jgi:N-acetyl-gamma-glutamyl-phosphate reductase
MIIKVAIVGVAGYTGIELLRLLQQHPGVIVSHVFTESYSEEKITNIYPHLMGLTAIYGEKFDLSIIQKECDLVFISLPHSHAMKIVPALLTAGIKIIDLGPDFRLKNGSHYQQWYQHLPAEDCYLQQAVYGLPEKGNKETIAQATLIANPGCYATAALLAALPVFKAKIIDIDECIFDAKSGVSGSGRSFSLNNHHCEITENLIPYKLAGSHRHIPEIEQELGLITGTNLTIQFTPHLVPMIRGLLITAYFK